MITVPAPTNSFKLIGSLTELKKEPSLPAKGVPSGIPHRVSYAPGMPFILDMNDAIQRASVPVGSTTTTRPYCHNEDSQSCPEKKRHTENRGRGVTSKIDLESMNKVFVGCSHMRVDIVGNGGTKTFTITGDDTRTSTAGRLYGVPFCRHYHGINGAAWQACTNMDYDSDKRKNPAPGVFDGATKNQSAGYSVQGQYRYTHAVFTVEVLAGYKVVGEEGYCRPIVLIKGMANIIKVNSYAGIHNLNPENYNSETDDPAVSWVADNVATHSKAFLKELAKAAGPGRFTKGPNQRDCKACSRR